MNKIVKTIMLTVISIFSIGIINIATPAFAADDTICDNPKISAEIKKYSGCDGGSDANAVKVITNVLNAIIAVLGIVAVIFVIVGGVKYMTSAGDPGKVQSAKNTVIYALIGLIVCALAFAIVNLVIDAVNKA